MNSFCSNPKCRNHEITADENLRKVAALVGLVFVEIERFLYKSAIAKRIFLCEVCHNAVEMISRSQGDGQGKG